MTAIEIIHGDCRDFDPVKYASKFQALIIDPPYSEHVHRNITSAGTMGAGSRGYHKQELTFGALTPELRDHIAAWAARVQGWAIIYSDHESSHAWRDACASARSEYVRSVMVELEAACEAADYLAEQSTCVHCGRTTWAKAGLEPCPALIDGYSGALPWERWSQPQKSGDRPPQGFEVLSLFWGRAHSRKAWNGPGNLTCLRHRCLRGADKHRTEKPLDQALDLVSWFSNAPHLPWAAHQASIDGKLADIPAATVAGREMTARPAQNGFLPVIDLCAGSGTTGVACALLGRAFVGFELDPENEGMAEHAERRTLAALQGGLSDRDRERAERWVMATLDEAKAIPFPTKEDGSDVKTWERAQRRLADAMFVGDRL